MISASTYIVSDPLRVYRFVADDANTVELYKTKYDITYKKDYETLPEVGNSTTFIGTINNISLTFVSKIVRIDEPHFIARHIRYTEVKINGATSDESMPEFIISDHIIPAKGGVKLKTSMALAGKYSFWKKVYYWYCYMCEYSELRRYVRFIKNSVEMKQHLTR